MQTLVNTGTALGVLLVTGECALTLVEDAPENPCMHLESVAGQRVWPNKYGKLRLPPCGYGQDLQGRWWVRPPERNTFALNGTPFTEHTDETISLVLSGSWRLDHGLWALSVVSSVSEIL